MTRILTIIALLFATPAWAEPVHILEPEDLRQVFSMSQADWEMNAANVALAGMGSVGGESALSPLSLTVFTEYGVVETAPFYIADKSNPKVVFIRVGMKKNSLITNGSLSDIQKITEKQLAEGGYSVKTREIDEVEDGYWLTFAIRP